MTIYENYKKKCADSSDINELLPYLKSYGEQVKHITEFGVREGNSTWAFLAALRSGEGKLISYDIVKNRKVSKIEKAAEAEGLGFEFKKADVLKARGFEPTQLLFIDTLHRAEQVEKELKKYADKVSHYIIFHDWITYGDEPEPDWNDAGEPIPVEGKGIRGPIEKFIQKTDWVVEKELTNNNGLLILRSPIAQSI